jgi:gamma-glutamyl-gamma-aminobutyrate hydrolase PuuD
MNFLKDFTILPGGSDVNPEIYNKKNYMSFISTSSKQTDFEEIAKYKKAVKEGRPIFGICRGLQLLAALNGLSLIQDLDHPSDHFIQVKDLDTGLFKGDKIYTNSCHHQAVWTENKLQGENWEVYGYTKLSDRHLYQEDEKITCFVEPEIIWFPKVKALGVQFHPEWMGYNEEVYKDCLNYLEKLVNKLY